MRWPTAVAAPLVFVAVTVLTACGLGLLHGSLSQAIAITSFTFGAAGAALSLKPALERPESVGRKPLHWLEWLAVGFFILVSLRSFLWLVFVDGTHVMVLSPNNLGDLTKHWDFIRYMASGSKFWPDNPLIAGRTIQYPIGIDLFNSLLALCGVEMIQGLIWVGVAGCLLGGAALFMWGRAFALIGLLCNGGFAGFWFVAMGELKDYQAELAWKNLFLSIIVTQRGFLFCLPAGLLLLDSWRSRWRTGQGRLPMWVELTLYATMPVFHVHTFMFLSLLLGVWICFSPKALRVYFFKLGLGALVPAAALMLLVTDSFRGPSFITIHPGWMQNAAPFLEFWGTNFGALIPLGLILCGYLAKERTDPTALAFVLPSCFVFLLCCLVLFAPWDWDNTKLMIWAYLTILPFLWDNLIKKFASWARVCLCMLLFFSGFVSLLGGLKGTGYELADRSELDALNQSLRDLPISGRFAAATAFNHPLLLLGRKVALAYPGYLFGHGIPYEEAERDLNHLMEGETDRDEAARRLQADYLFWGPREIAAFRDSSQPWANSASVVATGSWGTLYKLSQ